MSSPRPAFSIVLPCYNEAENIGLLLERYREVWRDLPTELILVDNGSTDSTPEVLDRELSNPEYAFARTVRVPVNKGYGYGVMQGLKDARGEVIGISHADMQCDASDLFRAYDVLCAAGPREVLVKGLRQPRGVGAEIITKTMAAIASTVLLKQLSDINAQPKVFGRELLEHLGTTPDGFELDLCFLFTARRLHWKIVAIPVTFAPRRFGTSKWAFSLASRRKHIWATVKYIFKLRFSQA
jgi:glycosyltransferase involved in cell wall biosynthesis